MKRNNTLRLGLLIAVVLAVAALVPAYHAQADTRLAVWSFPRVVVDGLGNRVTIKEKPAHIVSITLGTDEILLGLLTGDARSRIAAITENAIDPMQSNIPDDAKPFKAANKTIAKADPEVILSYKPDLVFVASYTDAGAVKQLQDAGVTTVALSKFDTLNDIEDNVRLVGSAIGEDQAAEKLVTDYMEPALKSVDDALKDLKDKKSVIFYGYDGYSWGAGTLVDEMLIRAGGLNGVTAGGIKDQFPKLSEEFLVKADPDYILLSGFSPDISKNDAFKGLKAVQKKQVVVGNDAHLNAVSQYVVLGIQDLATLLYPDLYKPAAIVTATQAATAAPTMAATVAATVAATTAK